MKVRSFVFFCLFMFIPVSFAETSENPEPAFTYAPYLSPELNSLRYRFRKYLPTEDDLRGYVWGLGNSTIRTVDVVFMITGNQNQIVDDPLQALKNGQSITTDFPEERWATWKQRFVNMGYYYLHHPIRTVREMPELAGIIGPAVVKGCNPFSAPTNEEAGERTICFVSVARGLFGISRTLNALLQNTSPEAISLQVALPGGGSMPVVIPAEAVETAVASASHPGPFIIATASFMEAKDAAAGGVDDVARAEYEAAIRKLESTDLIDIQDYTVIQSEIARLLEHPLSKEFSYLRRIEAIPRTAKIAYNLELNKILTDIVRARASPNPVIQYAGRPIDPFAFRFNKLSRNPLQVDLVLREKYGAVKANLDAFRYDDFGKLLSTVEKQVESAGSRLYGEQLRSLATSPFKNEAAFAPRVAALTHQIEERLRTTIDTVKREVSTYREVAEAHRARIQLSELRAGLEQSNPLWKQSFRLEQRTALKMIDLEAQRLEQTLADLAAGRRTWPDLPYLGHDLLGLENKLRNLRYVSANQRGAVQNRLSLLRSTYY